MQCWRYQEWKTQWQNIAKERFLPCTEKFLPTLLERHLHLLAQTQTGSGLCSLHVLKRQYNTLLGWISGAPGDPKASPFLHVEGLFLQLGPEGWLNCTGAYGSPKRGYLCVTLVLLLCCVAGPERAGTVRDMDQHCHAAEFCRCADLQVERAQWESNHCFPEHPGSWPRGMVSDPMGPHWASKIPFTSH